MGQRRLVILDKNFLQREDSTTPRLRALALCGCEFVLIDTLVYEICTDKTEEKLWLSVQKKLFEFAERVHVWSHASVLVRYESRYKRPVLCPEPRRLNQVALHHLRSRRQYLPSDFKRKIAKAYKKREIDSYGKLAPMARALGKLYGRFTEELRRIAVTGKDYSSLCTQFVSNPGIQEWMLKACYGKAESPKNYIPSAEQTVNESWFAFHNARANLALTCMFLAKYGLHDEPGKKFPNTKLDTDYIALLQYADAIATDETTGDMADMLNWLYGSQKKLISSEALLARIPSEQDIRITAYEMWQRSGCTHGHDIADWLHAEAQLYDDVWKAF